MSSNSNFQQALIFTLRWEGGYSNNPADKGGETNFGITTATYNLYRKLKKRPMRSVKLIEQSEISDIYWLHYWQPSCCDLLPPRLALCQFDWAVNAGITRAAKTLQQTVGVNIDGIIGAKTRTGIISALNFHKEPALCSSYCVIREQHYRNWATGNQAQFLSGWLNRLNALRKVVTSNN